MATRSFSTLAPLSPELAWAHLWSVLQREICQCAEECPVSLWIPKPQMSRERGWKIWGRSYPRRNAISKLLYLAEMLEMLREVRGFGALYIYLWEAVMLSWTSWIRFDHSGVFTLLTWYGFGYWT